MRYPLVSLIRMIKRMQATGPFLSCPDIHILYIPFAEAHTLYAQVQRV